ncbi:hypothetical protein KAM339_041150 [Aeromonas caviae]|nr:hypothetical protein KAM339_041150 [Aeromonas caviae]
MVGMGDYGVFFWTLGCLAPVIDPSGGIKTIVSDLSRSVSFGFSLGEITEPIDKRTKSPNLITMDMIEGPWGEAEIPIAPDAACNLFNYRWMFNILAVHQQNCVIMLSFGLILLTNPDIAVVNIPILLEQLAT